MDEYEKIARQQRREVSKLTLEQQRQILKLYQDSIGKLASKAATAKDKSLNKRWVLDYLKQLEKAKKELKKEMFYQSKGVIGKAAKLGTETIERIMSMIFSKAGIDPGEHFAAMFSQVQKDIIEDIVSGNLYKDNKTLSSRIWNYGNEFEKDIQYTINRAMLEKKSAIELARDLEKYVKDPAKRDTTWGRCYPHLRNKRVDYNAMRLARTSINHSYQTASIQSSNMNPFVEGIEWRSALIHGRTCELCRERHGKIFPKDDVPLDHPNGLCTMISYIPKSLDEVAGELRDWIDGENNPVLDDWYNEYGEYFSGLNKVKYDIIKEKPIIKTKAIKDYKLSDGTRNISRGIKRDVKVREYRGYKIVIPKNVDKSKQLLSIKDVNKEFKKLPKELRELVKEIQIVDYQNPQDAIWEKTYNIKGFKSFAVGGNKRIVFFENGDLDKKDVLNFVPYTLRHEAGHNLDQKLAKGKGTFSDKEEWQNAIRADIKLDAPRLVSEYARDANSSREDFADSIAMFLDDEKEFTKIFPSRAKLIRRFLYNE